MDNLDSARTLLTAKKEKLKKYWGLGYLMIFWKKKFSKKKIFFGRGFPIYGKNLKNIFSRKLLQNALNFDLKLILGDLDENWARTDFLSTEIAKRKIRGVPPPLKAKNRNVYIRNKHLSENL